jgi:hypothetical protein
LDDSVAQYVIDYKFDKAEECGTIDLDKCWDVLNTRGWEAYCHLKIKDALKVVASPIVVQRLIDNCPTYFDGINLEIKE